MLFTGQDGRSRATDADRTVVVYALQGHFQAKMSRHTPRPSGAFPTEKAQMRLLQQGLQFQIQS